MIISLPQGKSPAFGIGSVGTVNVYIPKLCRHQAFYHIYTFVKKYNTHYIKQEASITYEGQVLDCQQFCFPNTVNFEKLKKTLKNCSEHKKAILFLQAGAEYIVFSPNETQASDLEI